MDEQKINDLIYEIQRLVETLGGSKSLTTGSTSGSNTGMTDKNATKLIAALGILASKMGTVAASRKKEIRAAEDFAKSVTIAANRAEKQSKALEKSAAAAKALEEEQKLAAVSAKERRNQDNRQLAADIANRRREASSSRDVFEAAKQASGGLSQLNSKFLDLAGNSLAAQAGLQTLSSIVTGASKAVLGYSAALQRGERGAKLSGRALEEFATPVLDTVSTIGTLAVLLAGSRVGIGRANGAFAKVAPKVLKFGGATAVATAEIAKFGVKFVQVGLDQTDKLFDSFQRLSEVGISGAQGMDDVFSMLQGIGLTSGQIEQFNSALINNSQRIKFFGATAYDGAVQFAKVAGGLYKSKLGQQLENLGVKQQEMNELAAINLSIEARSGQLRKKTDAELTKSTYEFVKELDMAAQLTGASRKEMAEAREAALSEERFRAALVDARNRGDQEEIRRLEKARDMAAIIKKAGDEKGATGILQLAASGGAMTTEAAQAAEMQYGVNAVLNSQGSVLDGVRQLVETSKERQGNLAGINRLTGTISALQTGVVEQANVIDRIAPLIEKAGGDPAAFARILEEEQKKREAATGPDGLINKTGIMVDAARMQQNAALIQDKAVFQMSNAVTIHAVATKMFETAVNKFGEITGTLPESQVSTQTEAIARASAAMSEQNRNRDRKGYAYNASKVLPGGDSEEGRAIIEREMRNRGTAELLSVTKKMADTIVGWFSSNPQPDVPKFASGGIATGPAAGHLAMLHGTEAVIPLSGGSIPLKIITGGGMQNGPVFNPASETNFLLDKNTQELVKANVTLEKILETILDGATALTGGVVSAAPGGPAAAQPSAAITPDVAKDLGKGIGAPLKDMIVTSKFGMRKDPFTGRMSGHAGVDFGAKEGTAIYAPEGGTVAVKEEKDAQGRLKGWGKYIEIMDDQNKVIHRMAHLSATQLKTGQRIEAGQEIGKVGNTGRSTGAHLHWEKIDPKTGLPVDPMQWLMQTQGRTPGFQTTPGGAAVGYPHMTPGGRRATEVAPPAAPGTTAPGTTAPAPPVAPPVSPTLSTTAPAMDPLSRVTQSVLGMFGLGMPSPMTAGPGQASLAGITPGGVPGAIGGDIGAITQAMAAQTTATQTAITSGMENLTNQLVSKIGGGQGGTADPAVPTLLGEILSASREQTSAINRLIQVQTS